MRALNASVFGLALAFATNAFAGAALTETEVFIRCYSQITQLSIAPNDPLLTAVATGTKTAANACLETFDRAKFGTNGRIANAADRVSMAVLSNFHHLHASWFSVRDYVILRDAAGFQGLKDYYDIDTPAFYLTRAAFAPNVQFKTIVTSTKNLRAVRSNNNPALGAGSNRSKEKSVFGTNATFAPIGPMQGIVETGDLNTAYNFNNTANVNFSGTFPLGKHYGGGILGSPAYMHMTVNEVSAFKSDGGLKVPRRWSRAVYSDLLCRNLPLLRYDDVGTYKRATSTIPFRQSQGCVQCHASMDQMAGVIRGFQYFTLTNSDPANPRGLQMNTIKTPTQPAETAWPTESDAQYSLRPPKGVLLFRDSTGALKNIPVDNLQDLGEAMADLNDLYLCAAKRYYAYFTGIDITIGDPVTEGQTSVTDKAHYAAVQSLATTLKSTQSVRSMLDKLLKSSQYRDSSFDSER